jgi:hypothetical protein
MAIHDGKIDERTPLLDNGNTSKSRGETLAEFLSATAEEVTGPIDGKSIDGTGDEGLVGAVEPANPIFEGLPDVAKKMHLLFPVVAIGVSEPLFSN